jgi:hypothetical protein
MADAEKLAPFVNDLLRVGSVKVRLFSFQVGLTHLLDHHYGSYCVFSAVVVQ